jgi:Mg2+/Co2+ transporter CorC
MEQKTFNINNPKDYTAIVAEYFRVSQGRLTLDDMRGLELILSKIDDELNKNEK